MLNEYVFHYLFHFKKKIDNFKDLWHMKTSGRLALNEWITSIPCEPELASIITNAGSELIENCIKYSKVDTSARVEILATESDVIVETVNTAATEQICKIKEILKLIEENMKDLVDLYLKKIKKAQKTGQSQLGLIKIIMETRGQLTIIEESEKNLLHLQLKMIRQ